MQTTVADFITQSYTDATKHLMVEYYNVYRSIPLWGAPHNEWESWRNAVDSAFAKRVQAEKEFDHLLYHNKG